MEFDVRARSVPIAYPMGLTHALGLILRMVALGVVVGCGGDSDRLATYPVTGEVVYSDGSPLPGGRVEFRSVGISPAVVAYGHFGDDGKFQLNTYEPGDGAIEGEHKVVVSPDPPEDTDDMTPAQRLRAIHPIDSKFMDYRYSSLQFHVTDDATKNHYRIEVWPPGKGPKR